MPTASQLPRNPVVWARHGMAAAQTGARFCLFQRQGHRSYMQDNVFVMNDAAATAVVVLDGHGEDGEEVAATVEDVFRRLWPRHGGETATAVDRAWRVLLRGAAGTSPPSPKRPPATTAAESPLFPAAAAFFAVLAEAINTYLAEDAVARGVAVTSGCTFTCSVVLPSGWVFTGNLGDSPAWSGPCAPPPRAHGGDGYKTLTACHNVGDTPGERQRLLEHAKSRPFGGCAVSQTRLVSTASYPAVGLALSRGLGDLMFSDCGFLGTAPAVSVSSVGTAATRPEDTYVFLATDGFLEQGLRSPTAAEADLQATVRAALRGVVAGGADASAQWRRFVGTVYTWVDAYCGSTDNTSGALLLLPRATGAPPPADEGGFWAVAPHTYCQPSALVPSGLVDVAPRAWSLREDTLRAVVRDASRQGCRVLARDAAELGRPACGLRENGGLLPPTVAEERRLWREWSVDWRERCSEAGNGLKDDARGVVVPVTLVVLSPFGRTSILGRADVVL